LENIILEYEQKKTPTANKSISTAISEEKKQKKIIIYTSDKFLELRDLVNEINPKKDLLDFAIKRSGKAINGTLIRPELLNKYVDLMEDGEKKQIISKGIRQIFNKITKDNYLETAKEFNNIKFESKQDLDELVKLIINKAVSQSMFADVIAKVCKYLYKLGIKAKNEKEDNIKSGFLWILISECQRQFMDYITTEEKIDMVTKNKRVTFVKFLGELYKTKLLTQQFLDECIGHLFTKKTDDSLECCNHLLLCVADKYKVRDDKTFASILKKIKKINEDVKISLRIRTMYSGLIGKLEVTEDE